MNLICGINPVLEALQAGTRQFDRLLVVKGLRNRRVSDAITRASELGVPLRFETREALDRMASGVPHQGIIAVVSPKPVLGVHELLAGARDPALVVVLDGVEDPRNLGAILRTVEAAGADGVLLPDRHSAGLSETVARASAGALEHVKVARIGNVSQALELLKERGLWVIGLDANGGERWDKVDFKKPVALVLGGEGRGIRRLVREHCDQLVALPLFGHVTSLNVSVAAGAVLYEVIRQRGTVPSHVRPIPPSARPAPNHITGPAADDAEADPGNFTPKPRADDSADDEGEESNLSLVQIHDGDEPAWRLPESGPPGERRGIARTDGRDRGGRDASHEDRGRRKKHRDRDRGRDGGDRRPEPRPDGPPPEPGNQAPRPEGAGAHDNERRRRRRRRRPGQRRDGAPNPNPNPDPNHNGPRPSGDVPPQEGGPREHEAGPPPADGAAPNSAGGGPGDPHGRSRRRRRRRRH
jgi:23S rRNA (guanosine2251-2'-O)-methyltransferase